ncbi:hypothetical protein ACO1O0_008912 [Amphichorda felina]
MMEDGGIQEAPALPVKSGLRTSRFLEPIDSKAGLDAEQPPLSPATAPHDVYLSSEEDASSSADDFSDYDFESDSEVSPDSPDGRRSHEDTARVVSFVFYGKPSVVQLRPRARSAGSGMERERNHEHGEHEPQPKPIQRTSTDPLRSSRRRISSVSSSASSSILSTFSRSSAVLTPSSATASPPTGKRPAFLSIDPYASRSRTEPQQRLEIDRPPTPKSGGGSGGSMLRRTFSLARKRSRPALDKAAAAESHEPPMPLRPASVEVSSGEYRQHQHQQGSSRAARHSRQPDVVQAAAATAVRNSTIGAVPVAEMEAKAAPKGHSRLRSGLSISMGRRKLEKPRPVREG